MSHVLDTDEPSGSNFKEDDESIQALKTGTKKKKGRGLYVSTVHHTEQEKDRRQNRMDSSEVGDGDGIPQTSVHSEKTYDGWVLIVTGLHEDVSEEDIKILFSEFGKISSSSINVDRTTRHTKCNAMIEYETYEEALDTIEGLHDLEWQGRKLGVNWAFQDSPFDVFAAETDYNRFEDTSSKYFE